MSGQQATPVQELLAILGPSTSLKHLKIILKALDFNCPNEIIRELDPLHQGFVDSAALISAIEARQEVVSNEENFRRAFHCMDVESKGFLTIADLKRLNEENDVKISEEELQEMIKDADVDGLGYVTEESFVKFMMSSEEDDY